MKFQKHSHTPPLEASEAAAWFAGRLPADWFTGAPEVTADSEEILVVGTLGDVDLPETATDAERATARTARITGFRQDTRDRRVRIALEAEHRFGRKVSWGAVCGDRHELFTTLSVPFMTRLRMPERAVLDTLVEAGVARSRSGRSPGASGSSATTRRSGSRASARRSGRSARPAPRVPRRSGAPRWPWRSTPGTTPTPPATRRSTPTRTW